MSDEVAFVRGILSQPEDRLRWLVYADWLSERNDAREEWCRITAAWMEAMESANGKDVERLSGQRELARQGLDPNWLAVLDAADAFSIMLPAEYVAELQRKRTSGTLDQLQSWGTVQSDFRMAKVTPRSYVYAIQLIKGDVRIVGRLRMKTLANRKRQFVVGEFVTSRSSGLRPGDIQIVTGTEGVFLQSECVLPQVILERLRYIQRSKERGLSSLRDGKLANATTIQGVFRLAPQSRLDLAWLMFHPGEIPPLFPATA